MPITVERLKEIINFIRKQRIASDKLDECDIESLRMYFTVYDLEILNKKQERWYEWGAIIIMAVTMGIRGAEQCKNEEEAWKEYGVKLKDIQWIWNVGGKKVKSVKYTKNTENLEAMCLNLRNSKTKGINEDIRLVLGSNKGKIKPMKIIYEWYHHRKRQHETQWKHSYLFSMSIQTVKKMWKSTIKDMGVYEGERWRYHGLRKGFATSLQQRQVEQGLIAYGGRWSLVASMYRYIIYTLEDMKKLAPIMWDREIETFEVKDLDDWEIEMLKNVDMRKKYMLDNF